MIFEKSLTTQITLSVAPVVVDLILVFSRKLLKILFEFKHLKPEPHYTERESLVNFSHELTLAKCHQLALYGFNNGEIDDMIIILTST